ncbi:MAG: ABC transporter ATP-binding protein/permease, partial [Firmicutes bacterium]|nr:ABC transporter ATP-binding protein/permease [Bacillota bacterium]
MIKLTDVCKVYQDFGDTFYALKSINLEIGDKGMVFLLGKSGSGKSTLLNCLSGFDECTSGSIEIDGVDIAKASGIEQNEYRKKQVGYVAQDYNLLIDLSIGQNLELVAKIKGVDKSKQDLDKILNRVGLKGVYHRSCKKISGGQKQRVAIARALVGDPKVIFADEPTGNLDGDTSEVIFGILKELSQSTLVVVVSHDAESAVKYGDRIVKIENGKITDDQVNAVQESEQTTELIECGHQDEGVEQRNTQYLQKKETRDQRKAGVSVSFALRLGFGIIKKHWARFVAVVVLPIFFVGLVGVLVTVITFAPERKQLGILYQYDTTSNTMTLQASWPNDGLDATENIAWGENNMPGAVSFEHFFAKEQMQDYAKYGKLVLSIGNARGSVGFARNPNQEGGFASHYILGSDSKVVLWDEQDSVGAVGALAQVDGRNLLYGTMPTSEGGVLISDFVFNAIKSFGYKSPDGLTAMDDVGTMQDFLDGKPEVTLFIQEVPIEDRFEGIEPLSVTVTIPIVGIYETTMSVEAAQNRYKEYASKDQLDNPYLLHSPIAANMIVVGKRYFDTVVAKEIEPKYKYAIVPKLGEKSKDLRYVNKQYSLRGEGYLVWETQSPVYKHHPWSALVGGKFVGLGEKEVVDMQISVSGLKAAFKWVLSVFMVVSALLSAYFAASTISTSKKQIGILRGLGASGKDIFVIYASESLIGMLVTFGLGVAVMHILFATIINSSVWIF